MLRTTIYLDDDTVFVLRQLADAQNRSQAEIIREALKKYLRQVKPQQRPPLTGIGGYRSGRTDISEKLEEYLKKAARSSR